ncbi:MAG: PEP-CTERM sorting domain-containing protein [Candidatus Schekmanbacteria bacterium]|nr:MAG: PEP-CTERM sorting domain-containing protein [Candidatus Schekmanbacteria bacterium]
MMKTFKVLILSLIFFGTFLVNSQAITPVDPNFYEIPSNYHYYAPSSLDFYDSDDDSHWTDISLGFTVEIANKTYDRFAIDSNGYVQLMDEFDTDSNYGYGYEYDLIADNPDGTYLMAAYDDLSSYYYGHYGYKLESNRAIFFWYTETYDDEDSDYLNEFEIILYDTGRIEWHFGWQDYDSYGYDLFSGIYLGNTGQLAELTSDIIPDSQSFAFPIPEPSTFVLLGLGLLGAVGLKKKMK